MCAQQCEMYTNMHGNGLNNFPFIKFHIAFIPIPMKLLLPIGSNDGFIAKCHKILYLTVCLICEMMRINSTVNLLYLFDVYVGVCMFYLVIYRFRMCEHKFQGKIIKIIHNNDANELREE